MIVGCLEEVEFSVSSEKTLTPHGVSNHYSASYATHVRAGGSGLVEFGSEDVPGGKLSFTLNEYDGCNVEHSINLLLEYLRDGTALRYWMGNRPVGRYKWVIDDLDVVQKSWAGDGGYTVAEVTVSLKEYLRK